MAISVISSSQRSNSESLRISNYLADRIGAAGSTAEIHDLHKLALSTDIEAVWGSGAAAPVVERLEACDGAVFVTPEWAGMPSPALLNFLLQIGTSLAHKPVLLVGVSSGRNGSYPIAALRATDAHIWAVDVNRRARDLTTTNAAAIEASDRPRYEVEDDKIRALYGHSFPIDPGEPTEPPDELFIGVGSRDADRVSVLVVNQGCAAHLD